MSLKPGDIALLDGGLRVEIVSYNEIADRFIAKAIPQGGGENLIHGHVSNTRFELLESAPGIVVEAAKTKAEKPADGE